MHNDQAKKDLLLQQGIEIINILHQQVVTALESVYLDYQVVVKV